MASHSDVPPPPTQSGSPSPKPLARVTDEGFVHDLDRSRRRVPPAMPTTLWLGTGLGVPEGLRPTPVEELVGLLDGQVPVIPALVMAHEALLGRGFAEAVKTLRSRWMSVPIALVAERTASNRQAVADRACELVGAGPDATRRIEVLRRHAEGQRASQRTRAQELAEQWGLSDGEADALLVVAYGAARSHVARVLGVGEKYSEDLLGALYRRTERQGHAGLLFHLFGAQPPPVWRARARRRR